MKGKGCVKDINWERGGIQRVTLDRESPLYHAIYTQRTSAERINSKAKELGIERPKVRNGRSVANLNTLTYLILNVHILEKARALNAALLSNPAGFRQMIQLHPSRASQAFLPFIDGERTLLQPHGLNPRRASQAFLPNS